MRKKTLALFLTCVLAAGMLAGCGNKDSKDNNQVENSQGTESAKDDQAAAEEREQEARVDRRQLRKVAEQPEQRRRQGHGEDEARQAVRNRGRPAGQPHQCIADEN